MAIDRALTACNWDRSAGQLRWKSLIDSATCQWTPRKGRRAQASADPPTAQQVLEQELVWQRTGSSQWWAASFWVGVCRRTTPTGTGWRFPPTASGRESEVMARSAALLAAAFPAGRIACFDWREVQSVPEAPLQGRRCLYPGLSVVFRGRGHEARSGWLFKVARHLKPGGMSTRRTGGCRRGIRSSKAGVTGPCCSNRAVSYGKAYVNLISDPGHQATACARLLLDFAHTRVQVLTALCGVKLSTGIKTDHLRRLDEKMVRSGRTKGCNPAGAAAVVSGRGGDALLGAEIGYNWLGLAINNERRLKDQAQRSPRPAQPSLADALRTGTDARRTVPGRGRRRRASAETGAG